MKIVLAFLFVCFLPLSAETREGADAAAPQVASFFENLHIPRGILYTMSDEQTIDLIDLASTRHINVFELIDCAYRYIEPLNIRITILGNSIRKAQIEYDLGQERVLALLPVDKMTKLETGAVLVTGQAALDVFLESAHQAYIEIGTGVYDKRFGFKRIDPLLFAEPYGITIKKLFFSFPLEKLELYEPGKGAIYAKGISRPKKWNLWVITKK